MSTILTAIVFVKSANGSRTLSGTATARLDDDEYVDIQYKAFNVDEANLIDEIQENTIMLFAGKYIFDKSQLFVIVNKSTLLDLKTIEDKPTIYDLPISPLYGVITAPCVTPSKNQNNKHYFTMSRRTYDPFKGGYTFHVFMILTMVITVVLPMLQKMRNKFLL
ncbi:12579_t:CDS:2 [Entrophospora sp. SA101]|nr:12579_t:CDS:2 [Entrophospora sp. SA101]